MFSSDELHDLVANKLRKVHDGEYCEVWGPLARYCSSKTGHETKQ